MKGHYLWERGVSKFGKYGLKTFAPIYKPEHLPATHLPTSSYKMMNYLYVTTLNFVILLQCNVYQNLGWTLDHGTCYTLLYIYDQQNQLNPFLVGWLTLEK